jgi:2-aminoadipate transaminase
VALAFAALIEPGDLVVLDDPVFPDTVRIAEQYGGLVLPVRVGPQGIDVEHIAEKLAAGARIKIVYTVADFHNPSGAVLSAAGRRRLVELAERYGFVIVSDNPYRDTTFDGTYVEDFDAASDRVLRVGTFTKTLGAGLRLGWVSGPAWLVPHLENLRRRSDFHSNTLGQSLIQSLLTEPGWFDGVLERNRSIHAAKAQVFVDSLRERAGDQLEFTSPSGGFFVWARLAESAPTSNRLVSAAAERQLLITSGSHFAADGGPQWDRHLRFAFSAPSLAELPIAVDRLVAALAAR